MWCFRVKRIKGCKKSRVKRLSKVRIEKWLLVLKVVRDFDKSSFRVWWG